MYRTEEQLVLSPSDLNGYVQCRHLTTLDLARMRGEIERPSDAPDPVAALLSRKGDEHERAYLERLRAEGREIAEIADPDPGAGLAGLEEAARATEDAMRAGAEVIYQGTFLEPGATGAGTGPVIYRGHADFLFRVDDRPSALGDYAYEVADAKLARRAKPYFLLQICFYSELLHAVQGGEPPERVHVILGTGETESFRLAEFAAYFRRVRERFIDALTAQAPDTYPEPCSHCSVCSWLARCDAQRAADDHLSLVAGITRAQRRKLVAAGIETLEELGSLAPDVAVAGIRPEQLAKRREQAALQLATRESGESAMALIQPEPERGLARLPRPCSGDVFFDLEGDPFFEGGLEYLWGFVTADGAEPEFTVWWGRDRSEEQESFERFVDLVGERRTHSPDMHVYHYASYEVSALKRLAGAFGSREDEVDRLLRERVFVDLYRVVAEGLRIGMPSYSLKKVEALYMDQRETAVSDGNESVVEFERWLEQGGRDGGDQAILERIAAYNRDDCLSTRWLRDWLLARREAAERQHGVEIEWFEHEPGERGEAAVEIADATARLVAALAGDLEPEALAEAGPEERARWLLAQLLEYHHREERPVWWAFFDRLGADPADLVDDAECVADLRPDPDRVAEPDKRSRIHHLRFDSQEAKMGAGDGPADVATGEDAGKIVAFDRECGSLSLRRGPKLASVALPRALMPGGPYRTPEQRAALRRLAVQVIEHGVAGSGAFHACRDLLLRRPPRIIGITEGEPLYEGSPDLDKLRALVGAMDDTCLVIQGPPGSGKTWTGARLITGLIAAGKRVGVTSTSHKVIHNLLDAIEEAAAEQGLDFRGLKKEGKDNSESHYESEHIASVDDNSALTDPEVDLAAGTAWHFAREETDGTLDYLFVDEAGQVSLADALAVGTAARNVVLLGDPQQLPQVAQGAHPAGSSVSALEHVLGEHQTIPPTEGVFLDRSWRMHPDVCAFCSELMYEGRLRSAPGRERQRIVANGWLGGTGLRWAPVEHQGNSQSSVEEADAIAAMLADLEDARYVDCEGAEHPLTRDDVLVVTPYNAQVKCLEARLPAGARIGTVDKFQGQEAQLVFFSLATSSGAEIPRSLEFLLSRNRLNVAVSRARCMAVVVASRGLLEIDCATIEQMRLVNAVCRVAEMGSTTG